jgi:addiction module RelB/DinJ family antitoxin
MDENLKRDFEAVCGEMGLTMTSAFTIFAKTVSQRREIPFKIAANTHLRDTTSDEKALAKDWLSPEEDETWEEYTEIGARTVEETAGIGHKWANPAMIPFEGEVAWAEAAVKNEIRKQEDTKKYGIVGH